MDRVTNPETMREAAPDLTGGIPAHLWTGSDARTREWLLAEYGRQLGDAARQREAADAERQVALQRILARPTPDAKSPAAQLRRLQELLFEAAITARTLAHLPAADGASADAPASPTQEQTP